MLDSFIGAPSSKSSNTRTSCGNCRLRKVRCDAIKPVCTPCKNRSRAPFSDGDPCEYPGQSGLTHAEMLEADVSRLERRLRELESIDDPSSVRLQSPYSQNNPGFRCGSRSQDITPIQNEGRVLNDFLVNFNQEPHVNTRRSTLSWFLSNHGSSFGIYLNESRLLDGICSSLPFGHPSRPSPGLIVTLYLVTSRLLSTPSPVPNVQNDTALSLVLNQVSNMLSSSHPKRIIHAIQAEIILSNYFLHMRRNLEGRYHLNTALSLAAGAGLHRTRTVGSSILPPPTDSIEEGETINAFWTIYSMHNVWDAIEPAVGADSVVLDRNGQRIDVPWPLDMVDYEQGIPRTYMGASSSSSATVRNFLSGSGSPGSLSGGEGRSLIAIYSKASILFSRATSLANSSRNANRNDPTEMERLVSCLNHLDQLIDSFAGPPAVSSPLAVLTRTLAYASTIQLHAAFADSNARSHNKSIVAARAAADLVSLVPVPNSGSGTMVLNPIFAILWGIIGRVIAREIGRIRLARDSGTVGRRNELSTLLERILATMNAWSGWSSIMGE
ncbi:hypothetical protein PM082_009836 [Marasmius tenuissimus]|nr:hypothetical protein PM082_009836 [Marasmius tenuissimus]